MLYKLVTLDIKNEKIMYAKNLYTGIMIHTLIMKKQRYDCFMIAYTPMNKSL